MSHYFIYICTCTYIKELWILRLTLAWYQSIFTITKLLDRTFLVFCCLLCVNNLLRALYDLKASNLFAFKMSARMHALRNGLIGEPVCQNSDIIQTRFACSCCHWKAPCNVIDLDAIISSKSLQLWWSSCKCYNERARTHSLVRSRSLFLYDSFYAQKQACKWWHKTHKQSCYAEC